jgi:hypothetical protein
MPHEARTASARRFPQPHHHVHHRCHDTDTDVAYIAYIAYIAYGKDLAHEHRLFRKDSRTDR